MLVAAGLGTRLAPLTHRLPKPAVPVGLHPVAAYLVAHLRHLGIHDLTVNLFHRAAALQASLEPYAGRENVSLRFVTEDRLLGTAGGIRNAMQPQLSEDFVVANAKLLFAPDLAAAMALHRARGALATMVLKPMPPGARFGAVDIDAEGSVRQILARGSAPAPGLRRMMFTGVQVLSAAAHRLLPEQGCLVRDGYMPWLAQGLPVMAHVESAPFWDVGMDLPAYLAANMAVRDGSFPARGVALDARGNLVHPEAEVSAAATLSQSVIGARARIGEHATGRRVVVWPETQVDHAVQEAIVTPDGVFPAVITQDA